MSPYLIASLSAEAASRICAKQCRAMCCRGALILQLTSNEVPSFNEHATTLGAVLLMTPISDGGAWVRFAEHQGGHCPMLDAHSSTCRIYVDRPTQCRDFPHNLTPGCAISGG
ncbi:MAG: YkgJ family cysteine cluster protein [Chloroflexi bacterium]|nr:YkgJ family cysteine cluster protein [Chloroflexota bacterium]